MNNKYLQQLCESSIYCTAVSQAMRSVPISRLMTRIILLFVLILTQTESFSNPRSLCTSHPRTIHLEGKKEDIQDVGNDIANRVGNTDYPKLVSAVAENFGDGSMGSRGEEWVAAQFGVLFLTLFAGIPFVGGGGALQAAAAITALLSALALVAGGILTLETDLTPFPKPTSSNELRTTGIYSLVRHPIYGGLLLFCFGLAGITNSVPRVTFSLILVAVLQKKVKAEEEFLREKHGAAYDEYMKEVPATFIPFLFD